MSTPMVCSWEKPGSLNARLLSAVVTVTSLGLRNVNLVFTLTKPFDTRVVAAPTTGTPQSSSRVRRNTLPRIGAKDLVTVGTGGLSWVLDGCERPALGQRRYTVQGRCRVRHARVGARAVSGAGAPFPGTDDTATAGPAWWPVS